MIERPAKHVLLVTINRPLALNAINQNVARDLSEAVSFSEADHEVRAVVLTGAGGRAFCTGADLKVVADGKLEELFLVPGGFAGFVTMPRTRPWIAAVDGFALAGGFEIALSCDMIVAGDTSEFGLPEVRRGILASAGGVYRLGRRVPNNIASELICTGGRLNAHRAMSFGLVNQIAPAGEAASLAVNLASMIAQCAPIAVRESLKIARATQDLTDSQLYTLSQVAQTKLSETADAAEGPKAFLEKRPPLWTNS